MAPHSAQLCLGLCLCWGIWAQDGTLPKPSLRAEPGSVIPQGKQVKIWCEGVPGANLYLLRKGRVHLNMDKSADGREAQLLISSMRANTAGHYRCLYQRQTLWSEVSEPLELIVTGRYKSPSLLALPSSQVASGQDVTLQCQTEKQYNMTVLYKDEEQINFSVAQPHGRASQANFSILAATPAHGGTYQCYSFHSYIPHEWSASSDPLVLRVSVPGTTKEPPLPQSSVDPQALTSSPPNE
ncbi:platelet glycoprotein VI-like isoform X2 [Macrotis lagotis]|uniref:platelet glycoprotein VI-like isoform X2 n=1 Tax=Macrotis lagotis TaxID=92651 RepID=UPI003D6879C0